ncbi:unnamed protein product, partial [Iphiclides podalirius]
MSDQARGRRVHIELIQMTAATSGASVLGARALGTRTYVNGSALRNRSARHRRTGRRHRDRNAALSRISPSDANERTGGNLIGDTTQLPKSATRTGALVAVGYHAHIGDGTRTRAHTHAHTHTHTPTDPLCNAADKTRPISHSPASADTYFVRRQPNDEGRLGCLRLVTERRRLRGSGASETYVGMCTRTLNARTPAHVLSARVGNRSLLRAIARERLDRGARRPASIALAVRAFHLAHADWRRRGEEFGRSCERASERAISPRQYCDGQAATRAGGPVHAPALLFCAPRRGPPVS